MNATKLSKSWHYICMGQLSKSDGLLIVGFNYLVTELLFFKDLPSIVLFINFSILFLKT